MQIRQPSPLRTGITVCVTGWILSILLIAAIVLVEPSIGIPQGFLVRVISIIGSLGPIAFGIFLYFLTRTGNRVAPLKILGILLIIFTGGTYEILYRLRALTQDQDSFLLYAPIITIIVIIVTPLFGILADKFGRLRIAIVGLLLLSIIMVASASDAITVETPLIGVIVVAFGLAMMLPSLAGQFFEDTGSHRFLALIATVYLGVIQFAEILGPLAPLGFSDSDIESGYTKTLGLALLIGWIGLIFVGVSYLLNRDHTLQDGERIESNNANSEMKKVDLLVLLILLFLLGWVVSSVRLFFISFVNEQMELQTMNAAAIFSIFPIATLVAVLISGSLSDLIDWVSFRRLKRRLGQRSITILGLLVLIVGLVILLLAKNETGLAVALTLIGLGFGLFSPPWLALIVTASSHQRWGLVMGLYIAVNALAFAMGSNISGFVADRFGLRSSFTISLAVAVIVLIATLVAVNYQTPQAKLESNG